MTATYLQNRMNKVTTEYIVNKEKRTIVCIITTVNDVPERLEKYGLMDEDYDDIDLDIRIYKGIAKCAPGDEWNETLGRRLAEYRASKKRQVDVNNELMKFIKDSSACLDNLYFYGMLADPRPPREIEYE